MNYFDLYSSYPDHTIVAAWDCQVKEAETTPELADALMRRGGDLFPRFAVCYAELRALPRSARRALQRQLAQSRDLTATFPEWLQGAGWQSRQHKLARSLAGAALLLALASGGATAATITVTTKDPRVKPDAQCSLIEAIGKKLWNASTMPSVLIRRMRGLIWAWPNATRAGERCSWRLRTTRKPSSTSRTRRRKTIS